MTGWRVHRGRVLITAILACTGLSGCTGGGGGPVSMAVSPGTGLIDQPVRVSITGLSAGAATTVTATAKDAAGVTWSASADFRASDAGALSLDQAPTGGAYTGVNPWGCSSA
jgi:hypothetical protein